MHPLIVRTSKQVLAGLGIMLLAIAAAWAVPDFQTDLFVRYPNAVSLGCAACHTDPASGGLNPFGQSYLQNGLAFTPALGALDSDGDGVSNADELNYAPASNPGDPQSKPGVGPPPTPQPSGEGAALYGSYCASCHGPLASSTKRGASSARTQGAIAGNAGGMGYLSMLTPAQVDAISLALSATPTTGLSPSNHTGLWWNPAESGWGISLNHQGDTVFAALFTYSDAGAPMWLVMSAGTKQVDGRTYAGTLYRARGPAFDAVPFTPVDPSAMTAVGSLAIAFDGGTSATLTYTVNGATVVKRIVPQVFGGAAAVCTATSGNRAGLSNYQDLWWNPAESGWGVTITHQADTMFAALFTYDASGNDLWLVMTQGLRQADGSWRGDLFRTHGPAFNAQPFTPLAAGDVTKVGEARFAFSDGATGTLDFSVDGRAVTKSITRQVFASGSPSCVSPTAQQPVSGTDGAALYASQCASCHRPLETSTKGGASLARTQSAIAGNVGGMGYLSNLSTAQLEAITAALAPLVPTAPACGSCHAVPPVTGGHVRHEPRASCATCHGDVYAAGSANVATHNNGVKEVLAAIGWNAGAQTCANGCHGASTWSPTATFSCTSCHGNPPATGGHAKHNTRFACSSCHGAGYSSTAASAVTHRNGVKEVIAAAGWNATGRSCANSCHGSSTWSTTATLSCTSCHGNPPSTGQHRDHRDRACSVCHGPGYTTTTVNAATHNNGVKEMVTASGWAPSTRNCTNSCHGREKW